MIKKVEGLVKRLLPKHNFIRGVSVLVGGTAAAQAVTVLASPIKTRLFSPEDYGMVAVFASLVAMVRIISSMRYELAIPIAEDDREAAHLVVLSLLVLLVMVALSAVASALFGDFAARKFNTPELAGYFWLFPIGLTLGGCYQVFNLWGVRAKQFGDIARTKVRQPIVTLIIHLVGYKGGGATLLLGNVAGLGVGTFTLAGHAWKKMRLYQITWKEVAASAVRYRRFPIYGSWSGMFNQASVQLPPLMFASLFTAKIAGYYNLAFSVLAIPSVMIGSAVGNVFFSNVAKAYRDGTLAPLVEKVHTRLTRIAMPPTLLIMVAGPQAFDFVFGSNWHVAGEISRWLAPSLYIGFISSSLTTVFTAAGKQRQGMIFQFSLLSARVAALLVGALWFKSFVVATMLFSLASLACYSWVLYLISKYSSLPSRHIILPSFESFYKSSICLIPLIASKFFDSQYLFVAGVAGSTLLFSGYYYQNFRHYWAKPG